MLSILLINENKIVSRLFQLSSQKHNYILEEVSDYSAKESSYNVVFVDSQVYDSSKLEDLKTRITFDKLTYLGDKGIELPAGFDLMLEKPFLPTDFVNLMNENFKVVDASEIEEESEDLEELEELDELDLDNLEDFDIDKELSLENLEDDLSNEHDNISDDSVKQVEHDLKDSIEDNIDEKEQIKDIVAQIDELDDDKSISEELDQIDKIDDTTLSINDGKDEVDVSKSSIQDSDTISGLTTGIAATTATTVAAAVASTLQEEDDTKDDNLDILNKKADSASDIDEFDSISAKEIKKVMIGEDSVDDEFDSLSIDDVKSAMSIDANTSQDVKEEIVESKVDIQGNESLVGVDNLEELIARAVSKALTKELIHEALSDMDIVISLKPKES